MNHWINPEVDLGTIKAGSPKKIIFRAFETIPTIKTIIPYCGCTTANYNNKTRELSIVYKNNEIPAQVYRVQIANKRIDIIYEDNSIDVLIIKATRIR